MNRGVQLSGDTLNLSLESWLPESSLNQYRLGNCAEVDAVNQALNSGANASDLYLYTINTKTMYQNRCAKIVYIYLVIELQMCFLINWKEEVNGRIKNISIRGRMAYLISSFENVLLHYNCNKEEWRWLLENYGHIRRFNTLMIGCTNLRNICLIVY